MAHADFPGFSGEIGRIGIRISSGLLREFQNENSGRRFGRTRHETRGGPAFLWKSPIREAMPLNGWRS